RHRGRPVQGHLFGGHEPGHQVHHPLRLAGRAVGSDSHFEERHADPCACAVLLPGVGHLCLAQLLQDAHREVARLTSSTMQSGAPPFGVALLFCTDCACYSVAMNPVALTRQLIDIESITGKEGAAASFLAGYLEELGYLVERMPVQGERFNVFAKPANVDEPALVFSTHIDTVPPFLPSREDAENIYGRGACDAKGIIAAQVAACERLRAAGKPAGLLFVVGEE